MGNYEKKYKNQMNYMGLSMYPTFIPGDLLHFREIHFEEIKVGDVIIFRLKNEEKNIVHRVVSIEKKGLITRGDNNSQNDKWVVTSEEINGKVIFSEREGRKKAVKNGKGGLIAANIVRLLRRFWKKIATLLSPFYHWLSRRCTIKVLFLSRKIRVIAFKKPKGTEFQLFMGNYLIGRLRPGHKEWQIKRPFRLFVDVEKLPEKLDVNL